MGCYLTSVPSFNTLLGVFMWMLYPLCHKSAQNSAQFSNLLVRGSPCHWHSISQRTITMMLLHVWYW